MASKAISGERAEVFDDWLRVEVLASIDDKRAPRSIDEVFKRVRAKICRASGDSKDRAVSEA